MPLRAQTTLLLLTLRILPAAVACMHYRATIPFSPHLPVTASIEDNGVITCWLSQSYASHEIEQGIYQKNLLRGHRLPPSLAAPSVLRGKSTTEKEDEKGNKRLSKRSGTELMRLTEKPPIKHNPVVWGSPEIQNSVWSSYKTSRDPYRQLPGTRTTLQPDAPPSAAEEELEKAVQAAEKLQNAARKKERLRMGESEEKMWGLDDEGEIWMKWWFECLEGYRARMEPGGRAVVYQAHGQDFFFNPVEREDGVQEEWEYKLDLWCKGK